MVTDKNSNTALFNISNIDALIQYGMSPEWISTAFLIMVQLKKFIKWSFLSPGIKIAKIV